MRSLALFFFAEFAALALVVPPLGVMRRTIRGKMVLAVLLPLVATLALVGGARIGLWGGAFAGSTTGLILSMQGLAAAFALAVAGLSALVARRWPLGGPLAIALLAAVLLASPFWGDVLLNLSSEAVRGAALRWMVAGNPLFKVARELGFDWTHADVLYPMTRIGEDLSEAAVMEMPPLGGLPPLRWLAPPAAWSAWYAAVGLLAALLAAVVREHGRPAEYLSPPGERI